jgi:hypothetical protein
MTEDWEMEDEIRFAQSDVQDDAKEATEINKKDVVRQDFALISSSDHQLISSKTRNKELDLWTI